MVRSMTRILVLVPWIVLASAAANGDTIPIIDTDPDYNGTIDGTLTVTRTNNVSPGWDEIDLHFASWTVTYSDSGLPTFITWVVGGWTGVGGNVGVSPLSGTDWVPQTTNNNSNTLLQSFVNLDAIADQGYFVRGAGSAGSYASFASGVGASGEWFTLYPPSTWLPGPPQQERGLGPVDESVGAGDDGIDETLLAKIYVTSGGDVSFDGLFGYYDGVVHVPGAGGGAVDVAFTTAVPEPSAFALVGTGLVCAAIGVRRRRR